MGSCMYRRSSGIYVVRLAVPKRLRAELGRTEIHVSTELRELPVARIAALRILLGLRQKFMDLDVLQLVQGSPLLDGEGLISIDTATKLSGLSRAVLCNLLRESGARVYATPASLSGRYVDDIYKELDRDPATGEFESIHGKEPGRLMPSLPQSCWLHESSEALVGLGEHGVFSCTLLRPAAHSDAAYVLDEPLTLDTNRAYVLKSVVEGSRSAIAKNVTLEQIASAKSNQERLKPSEPQSPDAMLFSELLRTYLQEKKDTLKAENLLRMKTEGGYFLELVGDMPVGKIDRKVVLEKYKERLLTLPEDLRKAKKLCGSKNLNDLIDFARRENLPLQSLKTAEGHIIKVSEIFGYGVACLRISHNPLSGLVVKKEKRQKTNERRDVFSGELLKIIFSAKWFLTGGSPDLHFRPHYYWLPLLGLFTGARISELAQLYLHDIKFLENRGWVIDFNLNESDKTAPTLQELSADQTFDSSALETVDEKSLKNVNANRVVDVHSRLIQLGLIEYVVALRGAGYTRLFPEIERNASKERYGVAPAKWFNDAFLGRTLGVVRDGRTTFHSFRHTVSSAFHKLEVPEPDVAQILGHARGKTTSYLVYAKDKDVSKTVELLRFPETDAVAKFDVESGLKAIKQALRIKKSVMRKRAGPG
jgi:integrase